MSNPITLSIRGTPEAVAWVVVYKESKSTQIEKQSATGRTIVSDKTKAIPEHKSDPFVLRVTSSAPTRVHEIEMRVLSSGLDLYLSWPQSKRKCGQVAEQETRTIRVNRPRRVVLDMDLLHFYVRGNHRHSFNVVAFSSEAHAHQYVRDLLQN
jgi:hypothetical protein